MKGIVLLVVMMVGLGSFVAGRAQAANRRALLTERTGQILPLVIEGQSVELVWIYPSLDARDYLIEAQALLAGLKNKALPEVIARLSARVRPPGVLSVEDLRAAGVLARFDEERAEFVLTLAPEARALSSIDLMGQVSTRPREVVPRTASGYLNWRLADEINAPANQPSRSFLRGDLSGALSISDVVLESGADYDASAAKPWLRQDTRLVHEDFKGGTRWELGDLALRATAFQIASPQAGASFARSHLGPTRSRLYKPYGETQILLKRPSRVEVLTGDTAFAVFQAPAGPLELRNLPIGTGGGAGELKLRITDDLGTVEVVSLDLFFSSELVSFGESDYQFALGTPMRIEDGERRYDSSRPIYTAFFEHGVARGLNLGLNLQGQWLREAAELPSRSRHFVGLEVKHARSFGTISGAVTRNINDGEAGDVGVLVAAQLWPLAGLSGSGRSVYASVAYRGPDFKALDPADTTELARWSTDLTLAQNLGLKNRLSSGWRSDWYESRGKRETLSLEFERFLGGGRLAIGARSTTSLAASAGSEGLTERTAYARLTLPLGLPLGGASQGTLEYESASQRVFGSFSAQSTNRNEGHFMSGAFENQTARRNAFLSHRYLGERFEFSDDHQVAGQDGVNPGYVGRIGLGGSIAFAGDRLAIGRRIADSFAIVAAPEQVRDHGPEVRASSGAGLVRLGGWGPSLLPSLSSGVEEELVIDETVMPEGTVFRDRYFHLEPRYKSGFALDLELLGVSTVTGVLVDHAGERVAFATGEVRRLEPAALPATTGAPAARANPSEPLTFFTNAKGRFVIEGLEPGTTYEIELFDEGRTRYRFSLAAEQRGLVRFQNLAPVKDTSLQR